MTNKKLIFFDFDGVFVDSVEVVRQNLNVLNKMYGLPELKTKDDVGKLYFKNFYESLHELSLDELHFKEYISKYKFVADENKNSVNLIQGFNEFIRDISENNLCIITSNHSDIIKVFLKQYSIDQYFLDVQGGEMPGNKAEKMQTVLNKMKVPAKEAYFVTDTHGDIIEGKNVGVKTIGVTWGYHSKADLLAAHPDYISDTVEELNTFFR